MSVVVVLSYSDRSGIMGVYGPYDSPEHATKAVDLIKELPGMGDPGIWDAFPLYRPSLREGAS